MSKKKFIFRSETSDNNESNQYLFKSTNNNKINYEDQENYSDNEYVYDSSDIYNDKLETLYEDKYEHESLKENTDYDKYLFDKYFEFEKRQESPLDIRHLNETNNSIELFKLIHKNNFNEIDKYFKNGNTIFRNKKNNDKITIKSLCVKNNCPNFVKHSFNTLFICKQCVKTPVYHSFRNTNRGIKTMYNYLLKLLIITKKFRVFCECCKNRTMCNHLYKMNECFKNKKNIQQIEQSLDPKQKMELEINFYINKFMKVLSFLKCECKFNSYDKNYYSENFYNFITVYEIYLMTIPSLITLLKKYFSINENNEELYLINDTRCIHEDIQYYSLLTYCTKKNNNNIDYTRQQIELIMKMDNVNKWLSACLKINILMINEQSLEFFNYELWGKEIGSPDYQKIFEKLYNRKNIFIDLDYKFCNENIINIILKSRINKETSIKIINTFIEQYVYRSKFNNKHKKNFEEKMINYAKDCIEDNNYILGMELLKEVKNSSNIPKSHQIYIVLKCIFDKIIDTDLLTNEKKISFLKVINKNKINVSEYDFVSNLINYKYGDEIILGFDKNSNNLFKTSDYESDVYIKDTIKNCVINFKPNIMEYILLNLSDKIEFDNISAIDIYLTNIKKINIFTKKIETEHEYIDILEIILKYEKIRSSNSIESTNNKKNTKYYSVIQYCINNNLVQSAKLFIDNKFVYGDEKLILECILKNNHIIAEYLIKNNPELIRVKHEKLNLLNIIFNRNENNYSHNQNIQVKFIKKIVQPIVEYNINDCDIINEDDNYNESLGFLILSSNSMSTKNKIYLINYIKNNIDPMKVNEYYDREIYNKNTKNVPLIIYAYLLDEYEISFILLNSLIRHEKLDKVRKDSNSIFNNYYKNDSININMIPIIIKYLKDNHDYNENFDENNIDNKMLEVDKMAIIIILMCMMVICGYFKIILKYGKIKDNKIKEIKINKKQRKVVDNNKYAEIEIKKYNGSGTLFDTDNETNSKNNINKILFNNYNDIKKSKNKKTINNKIIQNIEDSEISEDSNDSSESLILKNEILFG